MIHSVIILPDAPDGAALLARRAGDTVEVSRGDVAALAPLLSPGYAVVLPGQHVRALPTDLPDRIRGAERLSVARFAHEDRLATDPDALHMVVGGGNPAPTAVVAPDVMDAVLETFDPVLLLSDFDALAPLAGQDVRLLDRVVSPGPLGQAVDPDWAEGDVALLDDDTLARAVFERIDSGEALNLRTGPYRRRTQLKAGPWARVAALALACAALGLGISVADARATAAQAEQLDAQARALYQQATGQAAPVNLASLARTSGAGPDVSGAFLDLSQILFAALSMQQNTKVERLSFEAGENALRLRLIYPDFNAAGDLETTVGMRGGRLATGGVREQNGRFIGDATLTADPS